MGILRGDIVVANLEPIKGSEQGRKRPVLIIQNNTFNETSPTTIIAPITSKIPSRKYLTSIVFKKEKIGLKRDSTILLNQLRTIDKSRIIRKISRIKEENMEEINKAIKITLGLE
ncbi:MAG: type II toxin-antitoxin system PemK/MazF family toxin [Nanoarchaeota archaeon]